MKYVIIGSALSGNKGAAAMLESTLQALGKNAQFTLLSMYPLEDNRLNTYPNLKVVKATPLHLGLVINPLAILWRLLPFLRPIICKNPAIRALSEANGLLDQGGITFVDGREKFLIYNIASILPGLMMRVPVYKCAQALGPFKNPFNKFMAKLFLPKVKLIVSRGRITHQHLVELGLKNIKAGADYAFSLEMTEHEVKSAQKKVRMGFFKHGKTVGVSPSVVLKKKAEAAGKDYVKINAELIDWLIKDRGYQVVLLPHSVRIGTDKKHNNDLPLCQEVYQQIKYKDQCLFIDQELSSQELRYVIGQCQLFIASRFHAMVSALSMSVPSIIIGWSHKYTEVLEMFELEDWTFNSAQLSTKHLQNKFIKLEKEQGTVRGLLNKHLPEVKARSLQSIQVVTGYGRSF